MLPGMVSIPGDNSPAPTITFKSHQSSLSNVADGGSYTFSAVAIGTATTTRIVACAIKVTNGAELASVTIGGISATKAIRNYDNGIYYAIVPTGTTADIVISVDLATSNNCSCGVYTIDGYVDSTHRYGNTNANIASHSSLTKTNVPVFKKSVGIFASGRTSSSGSVTWSSTGTHLTIVEDADNRVETNAARAFGHLTQTNYDTENVDLTITYTVASTDGTMIVAIWR